MRSPVLSDRFLQIDFARHSMSFLEVLHKGVSEDNLRSLWTEHLKTLGVEEPERMAANLEEFLVAKAPASSHPLLNEAKRLGLFSFTDEFPFSFCLVQV
jgi:hypothetical protein